jgi:hypothetical protein
LRPSTRPSMRPTPCVLPLLLRRRACAPPTPHAPSPCDPVDPCDHPRDRQCGRPHASCPSCFAGAPGRRLGPPRAAVHVRLPPGRAGRAAHQGTCFIACMRVCSIVLEYRGKLWVGRQGVPRIKVPYTRFASTVTPRRLCLIARGGRKCLFSKQRSGPYYHIFQVARTPNRVLSTFGSRDLVEL